MKKLFLILTFLSFLSLTVIAQTESRIIKYYKPNVNDDETYLEITDFKIGNSNIFFNESFSADENWLKGLKIKVKNISGKPITCIEINFGFLDGISEKLESNQSWQYALTLSRGDCWNQHKNISGLDRNFVLKNSDEIELTYANDAGTYPKTLEDYGIGKFHKAQIESSTLKFKNNKDSETTYLRAPNNVRYFDGDGKN